MKCRTKNTFSVDLCIKYVEFMSFSYPCNVNFFLIKMTACISMEMVLKLGGFLLTFQNMVYRIDLHV